MKIKNIVILAGGDSSRFWPLEKKAFISFLNKPLIKWLWEKVKPYGEKIIIVVYPNLYQEAKRIFKDQAIIIVQKQNHLGMAGAILSLERLSGPTLVINASDWLNFKIIDKIIQTKDNFDFLITAKKVKDYFPGGYLKFNQKGRLEEIIEKPPIGKEPSNLVRLVIDYFLKLEDFITAVKKQTSITKSDDLYEKALGLMIKRQDKIKILEYNDYFLPLKFSWQVLSLMNWFLKTIKSSKISQTVKVSPRALVKGPVILEKGVVIGDFAKVVGPAYIGQGTIVADHTLVYQSHIGNNCLIGGYSEVTRSYLNDKVSLHRSYVGDSVIDSQVMMGANTCLANLRFDEKQIKGTTMAKLGAIIGKKSKLGSGAIVIPGKKIGQNTVVGPGEIVRDDLGDNIFFYKNSLKKNIL